jgi:hypothetical protein
MKVKVIKTFADKVIEYKMYAVGEVISLPDDRALDAINRGLAKSAEAVKTDTAIKKPGLSKKRTAKKKEA